MVCKSAIVILGVSDMFTVQFLYLGGFSTEYTDNILYKCKNVDVVGWSFGPAA